MIAPFPPRVRSLPVFALLRGLAWVLAVCVAPVARGNGTGDDRVTLPDGAGSVGGSGQASVDAFTGAFSASYPVDVPAGFRGLTPALAFTYNSSGGASVLGIGWQMAEPAIERMSNRGLPRYDASDRFALDGAELVMIDDGEPAEFRARVEGGFARVRWYERGDGSAGYFTVETADGLTSFYGADFSGAPRTEGVQRGPDGVYRYLLVDVVDAYGHRMHHEWTVHGTKPLLTGIRYLFDGATPLHSVALEYEARPDPISDARGGFNDVLAHRLARVKVLSGTTTIRTYVAHYEDEENAYGRSRLSRIDLIGKDGGLLHTSPTFVYARTLDGTGACDGLDCGRALLTDLGDTGINLQARQATLIDLNADGIPDLIESRDGEPQRIRLGEQHADGTQGFAAPVASALGNQTSGFALNSPFVQPLDVDGDGDVDLLNSATATVLENDGSGDWARLTTLLGASELPDLGEDFGLDSTDQLTHARFVDIDLDRRIDVLRSDATSTQLFRNVGNNRFENVGDVDAIGAGFLSDNLEMADLNGDGLLDVYILTAGTLRYRLNLGRGHWAAFATIDDVPVSNDELSLAQLEDIDNDGCDDIVIVAGSSVKLARNLGGVRFGDVEVIDDVDGAALPARDATTTVLFADMNGNGSNDVVWFSATGEVTVLDLTPVPAHLLARLESETGAVRDVQWGTAAAHRVRDEGAGWDFPLPVAVLVVDRIDAFARAHDPALEAHIVVDHHYTGGFYDADEKGFRGFRTVTATEPAAEGSAGGITVRTFDVGEGGPERLAFAGRELTSARTTLAGAELQRTVTTWTSCPLADVDNDVLAVDVVFACVSEQRVVEVEGGVAAFARTRRERFSYDGYGRVVAKFSDGYIAVDGVGCEPCVDDDLPGESGACGATCSGDEVVERTTYADPRQNVEGRWILDAPVTATSDDGAGGTPRVARYFYDGDAFVGLDAGLVGKGFLSREEDDVGDGSVIARVRNRSDAHGNVVEELNPLADATLDADDDRAGDRTLYTYDRLGLHNVREERVITRGLHDGEAVRRLRRDTTYEALFENQESSSDYYLAGTEVSGVTLSTYDEFGRTATVVNPGDTLAAPSIRYEYVDSSPYSSVTTLVRSVSGSDDPADLLQTVVCLDGMGREVQKRQRRDATSFTVSSYTIYNARGDELSSYDAFVSPSGSCDDAVDASAPHDTYTYDALRRNLSARSKTGKLSRHEYRPGVVVTYDEDDTDPAAPGFDTPTTAYTDGLGRVVRMETKPTKTGALETYRFRYDDGGNLAAVVDPEGNAKVQERDALDRITRVNDATYGETRFTLDAAGNVLREARADGAVIVRDYDDFGRVLAEFVEGDEDATRVDSFYDVHPRCPAAAGGCTFGANRLIGLASHTPVGVVEDAIAYDERGNVTRAVRTIEGTPLVSENRWDNANRLVSTTLPDGRVIESALNLRGEVTAIAGYVERIEHDEKAHLVGYRANNGVDAHFSYDDDDRLASLSASLGDDRAIVDLAFERDTRGRLTHIRDAVNAANTFSQSRDMTYDGEGRLANVTYGSGSDAEVVSFAYDAVQRTTARTSSRGAASGEHLGALRYTDDGPHALSATDRARYDYDARGRLTTRTPLSTDAGIDDDALALAFDGRGRLVQAERDGVVTRFAWAGQSLRLYRQSGSEETWWFGNEFQIVDGVARVHVKVANDVVVEEDSTALTARFIGDEDDDGTITANDAAHKDGEAQQRRALRAAARSLLIGETGVARRYPIADHLGSVVAVTDDAGLVVERFATTATGALRASSAQETESARLLGADVDQTGLLDLGARFYAPHEGRFISPDPTFELLSDETLEKLPDSLAVYSYAGNDPVSSIDLDGRFPWKKIGIGLAVTAVAGAVVAGCVTGVLPALVMAGLGAIVAAATVTGIVGAVVGGVVGMGAALIEARESLKTIAAGNLNGKPSTGDYAVAAFNVVSGAVLGAIGGLFTGGISSVFDAARAGVTVAEHHGKLSPKRAAAARFVIGIGAVASFTNFKAFGTAIFTAVKFGVDLLFPAGTAIADYQDISQRQRGLNQRSQERLKKKFLKNMRKQRAREERAAREADPAHQQAQLNQVMHNLSRMGG